MLEELKERVYRANIELVKHGLVIFTWGNVSAFDKDSGLAVIKPSGVEYDKMEGSDMVVVDLDGRVVEGRLRPSSDTPTHIEIYKARPEVGAIVHTHSSFAVAWAQSGRDIPCYGTTHADHFYGDIPCTRALSDEEIASDYEKHTGTVILEAFSDRDILSTPGVLCMNHGPFAFGRNAEDAVYNAVVLEEIARMAYVSESLNPGIKRAGKALQDKHYFRKHGKDAYYGQGKQL